MYRKAKANTFAFCKRVMAWPIHGFGNENKAFANVFSQLLCGPKGVARGRKVEYHRAKLLLFGVMVKSLPSFSPLKLSRQWLLGGERKGKSLGNSPVSARCRRCYAFNPNRHQSLNRFCFIVEQIVCLCNAGVAGYVKLQRHTRCRQENNRCQ